MNTTTISRCLISLFLAAQAMLAAAADLPTTTGSQLMTSQERAEHRRDMQAAKTPEARAEVRAQQHEAMQARAQAQGATLPESPPAQAAGMGMQGAPGARAAGPRGMGRGR